MKLPLCNPLSPDRGPALARPQICFIRAYAFCEAVALVCVASTRSERAVYNPPPQRGFARWMTAVSVVLSLRSDLTYIGQLSQHMRVSQRVQGPPSVVGCFGRLPAIVKTAGTLEEVQNRKGRKMRGGVDTRACETKHASLSRGISSCSTAARLLPPSRGGRPIGPGKPW